MFVRSYFEWATMTASANYSLAERLVQLKCCFSKFHGDANECQWIMLTEASDHACRPRGKPQHDSSSP